MAFLFVLLLIVFLYLQWRNKTKKTKSKQNRQKANSTELVKGINISTGISTIERQGPYPQEALSAAIKYKKEKDFNKAIDSLYKECCKDCFRTRCRSIQESETIYGKYPNPCKLEESKILLSKAVELT